MTPAIKKIIENFETKNRELWGDKFFILVQENKVVLMTEGLVKKLQEKLPAKEITITSLDKDESVGEWFRVKREVTTHIHHYHRDSKETDRLLQNLPSKDMMTVEAEDGQTVTKNELMAGELFRGVVIGDWIAATVYHDFVNIAPKVIGWVKFDDRIELVKGKEFFRPEKTVPLDEIISNLVGLPYHLGGKSIETGFDCSSLVQWVMFNTKGIWLPKLAKWQALVGKDIDRKDIKKGDLIFFEEFPEWNIEHVGIFLGQEKILHASSNAQKIIVEISNLIIKNRLSTIRIGKSTRLSRSW